MQGVRGLARGGDRQAAFHAAATRAQARAGGLPGACRV